LDIGFVAIWRVYVGRGFGTFMEDEKQPMVEIAFVF
jgi:hypothetical protein